MVSPDDQRRRYILAETPAIKAGGKTSDHLHFSKEFQEFVRCFLRSLLADISFFVLWNRSDQNMEHLLILPRRLFDGHDDSSVNHTCPVPDESGHGTIPLQW